jgi:tetratricopeptide (TPR) repeat protein
MTDPKIEFEAGREALQRGLAKRAEGALEDAVAAYEQALAHFEAAAQPGAVVVVLNNLGAVAQMRGDTEGAGARYRDALVRAERAEDEGRVALSCGNLGALHLDTGDLVRAKVFAGRALELYTRLGDPAGRGNQLGNLGLIAQQTGDRDKARDHLSEAIGAFLAAQNPIGAGRTLLRFGEMAREEGDTERARDAFHRAGDLLARAGDHGGLAYVLRSLGQLSLRTGEPEQAEEYYSRGRDLHVQMGDRRGESASLVDLANVREMRGDPQGALELRGRALELARTSGSREAMASALLAIGGGLAELGRPDPALEAATEALTLYEAIGIPRGVVAALVTRAAVHRTRGCLTLGEEDLKRAAELLSSGDRFVPDLAALAGATAGARELRGDIRGAREQLALAADLYDEADTPAGRHRTGLITLQLDAYLKPERPLDEALGDVRLAKAQTFFDETGDQSGLWTCRQVEASLHRCHGEPMQAAARFDDLTELARSQGRILDEATTLHAATEARIRAGEVVPAVVLQRLESCAAGSALLSVRVACLQAEAALQGVDTDAADAALARAREMIDSLPDGYASGETLTLDATARIAAARGEVDRARQVGDEAIARYTAVEDNLGAAELRQHLS